ncbi:MAG TPA: hypothetical protein VM914_01880 [Pyrinomonadaceae bacterium]|nr:hypothetical protein [Pyrinomonadaceae bacterium]
MCGGLCRERIETLVSRFDETGRRSRQIDMNQTRVDSQMARTAKVYKRLSEANFKGAVLSGVGAGLSMLYSGLYANFVESYFAFGLGVVLLVMAFVMHFRSRAFREFYEEQAEMNRLY